MSSFSPCLPTTTVNNNKSNPNSLGLFLFPIVLLIPGAIGHLEHGDSAWPSDLDCTTPFGFVIGNTSGGVASKTTEGFIGNGVTNRQANKRHSWIWDGACCYPHVFGAIMITKALLGLSTSYFGGIGVHYLPYLWPGFGVSKKQPREQKRVRVYMDGCFDLMHYGHANALRQAKVLGDELVVGVVSDEEILANKGPPVLSMEERNTKSAPNLLKEVYFIANSGEKHAVVEWNGDNWSVKGAGGSFKLQKSSGNDDSLFELLGYDKMVKIYPGKRLVFQLSHFKNKIGKRIKI